MINLKGYDQVSEFGGNLKKPPAGGYVCRILKVTVGSSTYGGDQLALEIDIAEGEFAGYFKDNMRGDRWNHNGIFSCYIFDNKTGQVSMQLKSLLGAVERSDPSFKVPADRSRFDENDLVGKICGFTFGEREYEYDGQVRTTVEVKYPHSADKIRSGDFNVPPVRKLKREDTPKYSDEPQTSNFNLPF